MVGILVDGDNHFIVRGPAPDVATAHALVRNWSLIRIGGSTPEELLPWRISTKEYRQDLRWAVVVGSGPHSVAVTELLYELRERGVSIQQA